ncbi:hypothetical protein GEV49_20445 [Streptomyces sp. SYP-A7193]|nr:hypothetical protein GEV49_20445 [Streptomyces sp. SYP-A7193]
MCGAGLLDRYGCRGSCGRKLGAAPSTGTREAPADARRPLRSAPIRSLQLRPKLRPSTTKGPAANGGALRHRAR